MILIYSCWPSSQWWCVVFKDLSVTPTLSPTAQHPWKQGDTEHRQRDIPVGRTQPHGAPLGLPLSSAPLAAAGVGVAEAGTPTRGPLTFWWLVTSSLLLPSSSASFTFSAFSAESCWDFWAAACFRVSLQGQWVQGYHRNKTGTETVGADQLHSTEENVSGSRAR